MTAVSITVVAHMLGVTRRRVEILSEEGHFRVLSIPLYSGWLYVPVREIYRYARRIGLDVDAEWHVRAVALLDQRGGPGRRRHGPQSTNRLAPKALTELANQANRSDEA